MKNSIKLAALLLTGVAMNANASLPSRMMVESTANSEPMTSMTYNYSPGQITLNQPSKRVNRSYLSTVRGTVKSGYKLESVQGEGINSQSDQPATGCAAFLTQGSDGSFSVDFLPDDDKCVLTFVVSSTAPVDSASGSETKPASRGGSLSWIALVAIWGIGWNRKKRHFKVD